MADFRPFIALRYDPAVAGDPSSLVAPPYDVVSEADRAALYARGPYNISHVDFGEDRPGDSDTSNRYTRARERIADWLEKGVLRRDESPGLYVYDQEFSVEGERRRRRALFGRLGLEEWERGIVLPHEDTMPAPKADRLDLLRATGVNLSPIMAMYRNDTGLPLVQDSDIGEPVFDATAAGERHVLAPLSEGAVRRFCDVMTTQKLYVADGHHRYETALAYREERRKAASAWTGEEPENFVLAALVDTADPGLVVLPMHRIVTLPRLPEDAISRLARFFEVEEMTMRQDRGSMPELMQRLASSGRRGTTIGVIGLTRGTLQLLRRRPRERSGEELLPAGHADLWRGLDVNVLHHIVFPTLGLDLHAESIEFTADHRYAAEAAAPGSGRVAFLLNPTPAQQVLACADAGERMPQKSTFFYPKLATGIVMYPLS
jgi:uncharacterized protein (DUF1015 family)